MRELESTPEIENIKQIQQFNTFDVLSVALCFVLVLGVGGVLIRNHSNQKNNIIAKSYVENLAHELVMKPVISSNESGRLPASEQDAGLDPWGEVYKYKVVKNSYGQPIYLVVLSSGPNNILDTQLSENLAFSESQIEGIQIMGDDIGYIKSYR